jgi:hypothetical protein
MDGLLFGKFLLEYTNLKEDLGSSFLSDEL